MWQYFNMAYMWLTHIQYGSPIYSWPTNVWPIHGWSIYGWPIYGWPMWTYPKLVLSHPCTDQPVSSSSLFTVSSSLVEHLIFRLRYERDLVVNLKHEREKMTAQLEEEEKRINKLIEVLELVDRFGLLFVWLSWCELHFNEKCTEEENHGCYGMLPGLFFSSTVFLLVIYLLIIAYYIFGYCFIIISSEILNWISMCQGYSGVYGCAGSEAAGRILYTGKISIRLPVFICN